jgi:DNA-binding PadR family transcriptional regulator
VTGLVGPAHGRGARLDLAADQEEGRADAVASEDVEQLVGGRAGTVVEGQLGEGRGASRYRPAMPRDELSAGEWAVLALVAEEPTHGFAIARAMAPDGEVGKVWSVRRPLVYRAVENLAGMGLVRAAGTEPGRAGPQRTVLEITPAGRRELARWLGEPVAHVRDARSLLMLKLLFLARADADSRPLLGAQREHFAELAERLGDAAARADGFDRALALWRLESTTAAVRFVEAMLADA